MHMPTRAPTCIHTHTSSHTKYLYVRWQGGGREEKNKTERWLFFFYNLENVLGHITHRNRDIKSETQLKDKN